MAKSTILQLLITLAVLLFAAKLFASVMRKIKQPVVLGDIIAGIVIGPFALGGLPSLTDSHLLCSTKLCYT